MEHAVTLQSRPLAVIILAAGQGTRMKSPLHKVLHPLAGKPMICHLLEMTGKLGAQKRIVVVGEAKEQVMAAVRNVDFAVQEQQWGTGHAVMTCREQLAGFSGDVLVLYGDVPLISCETIHRMKSVHQTAIRGQRPAVTVLGFRPEDGREYGRLVMSEDGQLEAIVEYKEATTAQRRIGLCNSGIMMIRGELLFRLLDSLDNQNAKGEYYLTDLVRLAREAGYFSAALETSPLEVTGVNTPAELSRLEELLRDGQDCVATDAFRHADEAGPSS